MSEIYPLQYNKGLIGKPGSISELNTPALILDLDILESNILKMAQFAKEHHIYLRPHAKTHKSIKIAQKQLTEGALGVCCATVGEASVMTENGISGVLITSPIVTSQKIQELMRLQSYGNSIIVTSDNNKNIRLLNDIVGEARQKLDVIIDIDVGLNRTGASDIESSILLAKLVNSSKNLNFVGIQGYAGHLQHLKSYNERVELVKKDLEILRKVRDTLTSIGLKPSIVTGGGTGTHFIDANIDIFTELQVGSYSVMDVEYLEIEPEDMKWPYEPALTLLSSVVSSNQPGIATIDAGLKVFATDGPEPTIINGAPEDSKYQFFGDEHGKIILGQTNSFLKPGDLIELIVPHCDPTINLHDYYYCVRGDTLVDIWNVDARGMH
tara:strand:- start:1301 stop:2446 length:1146 start_codon:yes stop_codon:yes gene_type:complete